jgi:hypothetical protein
MLRRHRWGAGLGVLAALTLIVAGCGRSDNAGGPRKSRLARLTQANKEAHDHSGWWCDEHGVPEEECSMCSAKVAAEFKKKGDWCDRHERAKSQCFLCDPGLKDKYAAQYEAKTGKKPPEPEDNMPKKEDKKG